MFVCGSCCARPWVLCGGQDEAGFIPVADEPACCGFSCSVSRLTRRVAAGSRRIGRCRVLGRPVLRLGSRARRRLRRGRGSDGRDPYGDPGLCGWASGGLSLPGPLPPAMGAAGRSGVVAPQAPPPGGVECPEGALRFSGFALAPSPWCGGPGFRAAGVGARRGGRAAALTGVVPWEGWRRARRRCWRVRRSGRGVFGLGCRLSSRGLLSHW